MAQELMVDPAPAADALSTVRVRMPLRASSTAIAPPSTPAPMITASTSNGLSVCSVISDSLELTACDVGCQSGFDPGGRNHAKSGAIM